MNVHHINLELSVIRDFATSCPEMARSREGILYTTFVHYVAVMSTDAEAAKMARALLESKKIDFERYCA